MRFIVADSKAALANGVYTFNLNMRLPNATKLWLKKCSFQVSGADPPLAIMVRSNALHQISGEKHTVELKAENHQDACNILAILEESHQTGRYHLKAVPRPLVLRYPTYS